MDLFNDRLNGALREISSREQDAPLIFVDTDDFPRSYKLLGRYKVQKKEIIVNAYLVLDKKTITRGRWS